MIHLVATRHAHQRARQRIGWSTRTLDRMLERVFYFGVRSADCPRTLRAYLDTLPHEPGHNRVRIYGQQIFIFAQPAPESAALLTVYQLPPAYRAAAHRAQTRTPSRN